MTKTQKLLAAWYGYQFQSSCSTTPEFAKFAREAKAAIKSQLQAGDELVSFNRGHFYFSGFIRRGDKFVYFMSSDVRYFRREWADKLLIRTAQHDRDYTGGRNQHTQIQNLGVVADQIFEKHSFVLID